MQPFSERFLTLAPCNELEFSRSLLSKQNIRPIDEKIVKDEQTENVDLRIGCLNSVFCLFFSLGLAVNNGQFLLEISVIFLVFLNLLKCPINTRLLPHVEDHIIEYKPL